MKQDYTKYKIEFLEKELPEKIINKFPDRVSESIYLASKYFGCIKIGEVVWYDDNHPIKIWNLENVDSETALGRFCRLIDSPKLKIEKYHCSIFIFIDDDDVKFISLNDHHKYAVNAILDVPMKEYEIDEYIKAGDKFYSYDNFRHIYTRINPQVVNLIKHVEQNLKV